MMALSLVALVVAWTRAKLYEESPLKPWGAAGGRTATGTLKGCVAMFDGCPFLFVNQLTRQKVIVCLNAKVGSTHWMYAMLSASQPNAAKYTTLRALPYGAPVGNQTLLSQALADPSVPRFIMVRNPYSRLLSAYMNKVANGGLKTFSMQSRKFYQKVTAQLSKQNATAYDTRAKLLNQSRMSPVDTFAVFVSALTSLSVGETKLDHHFEPLSGQCGPRGSFDYVLRVEELLGWYRPFVHALGLEGIVAHGWNSTQQARTLGFKQDCFHTPPGGSCTTLHEEPTDDGAASKPSALKGKVAWRYSEERMLGQFFTPGLAALVTEWAAADLAAFGYPSWSPDTSSSNARRSS